MDKYNIDPQKALFLLVDFQSNLAAAMKKDVYAGCERNAGLAIASCNILKVPVLVTEQYSKGLGPTVERLKTSLKDDYKPLDKLSFSCYRDPGFLAAFSKLDRKYVLVAGIEAHVCVLQSVVDMVARGYYVHVLSDAVCSRYKNDWVSALRYMGEAGAIITTTEIAVFQLLQKAGTPDFKAISPLFRDKESYWSDR
jgi:nicotinamidase-related amidase